VLGTIVQTCKRDLSTRNSPLARILDDTNDAAERSIGRRSMVPTTRLPSKESIFPRHSEVPLD
jgi:hypothetical protein